MNNKSWKYEIKNQAKGPSMVMIYDDIGSSGITADAFVNDLKGISGDLDVHINTSGGDVFQGIAIYNALSHRSGKVQVTVDALAASIGSVIAMAATPGDLVMAKNASMMIHEGHALAMGDAEDMAKMADTLNKASDNIASIYADRTGKPASYWREQMKNETWFSAQEAVAAGLADSILPGRPQNSIPEPEPQAISLFMPYEVVNVKKPYGDVKYADPGYLDANGEQVSKSGKEGVARYPIDEEHVKAAWSYINQEKNASQYTSEQLSSIKSKIKKAMKKHGHDVADNELITKIVNSMKEVFNL